ncbi:hypothetical protein BELL_0125g00140 [Botrytis elliptica]|uniref:Uncharacterized protein n=1 Tax=Botrytis elliptica TaxID=278938 RepID=A0A4Z1K6U4_9HELO|nr:hypothetical protein EAE99_005479 [Botrytis elliptica]TGO77057.1 hypothetical protein BELL_0125g00140 [Botrytis elliptica]
MKYLKWLSIGRKEKVKDNKVSIDDLKDGSSASGKLKGSILKETLRSMELSSQCTVDTQKNTANGSAMGISGTKTSTGPSRKTSVSSKRKSWYSLSSRKSEDCGPIAIEQTNLCNRTENPKDRKKTSPHATKQPPPLLNTHKHASSSSITIIVTSPTSDTNIQTDSCSVSSTSSHSSSPSLKSTSSFDPSLLMPPFPPTPLKYDIPKSNEAPEVKKWLIGCMNRKADTLPRKLVFRMMEIYGIKKEDLDPTMWGKLQEGVVDEGVVLSVDADADVEGKDKDKGNGNIEAEKQDLQKEKKKEESNSVDALQNPRISFYSRGKRGRKDIPYERPNNTILTKRHTYPNSNASSNNNKTHIITTIKSPNQNPNPNRPTPQSPPPKTSTTNPRVWQNPSSRARNWPTTIPNNNNMMNMHHPAAFSFPPYAHTNANPHAKSRPSSQHGKHHRYANAHGNGYGYGKMTKKKRGVCPPCSRRGSMVSLGRIPEHEEGFGEGRGSEVK